MKVSAVSKFLGLLCDGTKVLGTVARRRCVGAGFDQSSAYIVTAARLFSGKGRLPLFLSVWSHSIAQLMRRQYEQPNTAQRTQIQLELVDVELPFPGTRSATLMGSLESSVDASC